MDVCVWHYGLKRDELIIYECLNYLLHELQVGLLSIMSLTTLLYKPVIQLYMDSTRADENEDHLLQLC